MKYKNFRDFRIKRTCNETFDNYEKYKPYLAKDFHNRCAYCNTKEDTLIGADFAVDHYVPRKIFEDIDMGFETNYDNLMYACPKCNRAKSSKYERRQKELNYK